MKVKQYYKGHWIELFPQEASNGSGLCRVTLDGKDLTEDENGIRVVHVEYGATKKEAQEKVLTVAKESISLRRRLEGKGR
jgi:hypothetical protein